MRTVIKELTQLKRDLFCDFGWGNGYVLIPIGHKLHGQKYREIDVDVHGGLTFSEEVTPWHIEAYKLEPHDLGKWLVGFSTTHYDDTLDSWPKERVQEEADSLMKQLMRL
jgi:hypothetical protein